MGWSDRWVCGACGHEFYPVVLDASRQAQPFKVGQWVRNKQHRHIIHKIQSLPDHFSLDNWEPWPRVGDRVVCDSGRHLHDVGFNFVVHKVSQDAVMDMTDFWHELSTLRPAPVKLSGRPKPAPERNELILTGELSANMRQSLDTGTELARERDEAKQEVERLRAGLNILVERMSQSTSCTVHKPLRFPGCVRCQMAARREEIESLLHPRTKAKQETPHWCEAQQEVKSLRARIQDLLDNGCLDHVAYAEVESLLHPGGAAKR